MIQNRQETDDWYDDAKEHAVPRADAQALPEISEPWRYFGWSMAATLFSALWLLESWTASPPGENAVETLAESVWALLLALGICYGTYTLTKAHSRALAHLLCVVSAIVLLLHHASGN